MHILPINFDDRHFQTWDTHIKIGHGRPVDETQPDLLTRAKDTSPIVERRGAVHQIGVRMSINIRQVSGCHSHAPPFPAVAQGFSRSEERRVGTAGRSRMWAYR